MEKQSKDRQNQRESRSQKGNDDSRRSRDHSGKTPSHNSSLTSVAVTSTHLQNKTKKGKKPVDQIVYSDASDDSSRSHGEDSEEENVLHANNNADNGSEISTVEQYLRRNLNVAMQKIEALEVKVDTLSKQMNNIRNVNPGGKEKSSVEITEFIVSKIGTVVREQMFPSIKYLDDNMLQNQGNLIFDRVIKEAHIKKEETNAQTFSDIIKMARKFLNVHKCHVRKNLRLAAVGKKV
jgi:hypothetical protein